MYVFGIGQSFEIDEIIFARPLFRFLSVIITQTVGQMTDEIASTTQGTQTPLPQTCLSFSSLTGSAITHQQQQLQQPTPNSKYSPFEQKILENELLLQTQRNALKNIDRILNDKRFVDRKMVENSSDAQRECLKPPSQPTKFRQQYMNIDQTTIQCVILLKMKFYPFCFFILNESIFFGFVAESGFKEKCTGTALG